MNAFTDCWYWAGSMFQSGYGALWDGQKLRRAHRAIYEALVAEIPEDLVLDHLCMNKVCINPNHLEPVTQTENMKRFDYSKRYSPLAERTHCNYGHPFGNNTRTAIRRGKRINYRLCVTCDKLSSQRRRLKHKNAVAVIS